MKLNKEFRNNLEADIVTDVDEDVCVSVLNAAFKCNESLNVTRRVLDMSDNEDAAIAVKYCGLKAVYAALKDDEDYNTDCCAYYHLEDRSHHMGVVDGLRLRKIERISTFLCENLDEVVQATLESPKDNPEMYSILLPYLKSAISTK